MIGFALVMVALLGGATYYIARRLHGGLRVWFPRLPFAAVLSVLGLLTLVLVAGFFRSMLPLGAGFKRVLGVFSAYWMGAFIYLLLYTLAVDALRGLGRLCRLSFVKTAACRAAAAVAVLALTVATVLGGAVHARQICHVSYTVEVDRQTDVSDMKLVLISDLHLGAIGSESRLEAIVEEINRLSPDVVCMAGDVFDSDFAALQDPQAAKQTLRGLSATYGVYACLGNHDAGATARQMVGFLEACGIRVLQDEYTLIDERLYLVGRLDGSPIGGYDGAARRELSDVFQTTDGTRPVVVLDHNPAHIGEYTDSVDLILSGHTHRGQLFPANLVTGLLYDVDYGYYRRDAYSPQVIVTSGVGYWGMPMRVGTDSEIVSITIT